MKNSGIYKLTNIIDNKFYIGSAIDLTNRKSKHKTHRNNTRISRAINKYGWDNFKWEVLEYCDPSERVLKEQEYLDKYQPFGDIGYNILKIAKSSTGFKHSDETKLKLSLMKKKLDLTGSNNPFFGKKLSKEILDKMSSERKIKYKGDGNPFYGKSHSEESKLKISVANTGQDRSFEYKPVDQFTLEGEFVKTYPSLSQANIAMGKPANDRCISAVCRGLTKSSSKFRWKFKI